jgi:ankyrin repeat protein
MMKALVLLFSLPLICLAQVPTFFDLDLRSLDAEQIHYPAWLEGVSEEGGAFNEDSGWQLDASKPFGVGRLFIALNRDALDGDLALSFYSGDVGNIAVQLYDANDRVLAVDLLAKRYTQADASLVTLVLPLRQYPTAQQVVLRRLDGGVAVSYLSMLELSAPLEQDDADLHKLAALLGDPLAAENPLLSGLKSAAGDEGRQKIVEGVPQISQPLLALSQAVAQATISESDLITLLQILGLQGYDFDAIDFVRAAGEGREEVVKLYLRAGMPIDVQGRNKYTAVAEAATSGELRVLQLLCDEGADLEIRTAGGNSALWMACISSHYEAIRLLVANGADVDARGAYGNMPMHKVHQQRAHNYNKADETVIYLLEHGANPNLTNDRGNTIVHEVARYGRSSTLEKILKYEPNLYLKNKIGFTPMMLAQYRRSSTVVRMLEKHGVPGWEPSFDTLEGELVYYVYRNESAQVERLLAEEADPNALDMKGNAIVFKTVLLRNLNMLKRFKAAGADFNVRDGKGRSLLGYVNDSYYEAREAIVDYLLEQGLDPNYATVEDLKQKHPYYTPLMSAAGAGNVKRCQRLLAAGADPTVKNLPGRTAAMVAERAGYFQLSQELQAAEAAYESPDLL